MYLISLIVKVKAQVNFLVKLWIIQQKNLNTGNNTVFILAEILFSLKHGYTIDRKPTFKLIYFWNPLQYYEVLLYIYIHNPLLCVLLTKMIYIYNINVLHFGWLIDCYLCPAANISFIFRTGLVLWRWQYMYSCISELCN